MENKFDHVPSEIFDWMNESSFALLDAGRQKKVRLYFTSQEFDEMHGACSNLRSFARKKKDAAGDPKAALLSKFDSHHAGRRYTGFDPSMLWKAASVVLTIALGLQYYQAHQKKNAHSWSALVDTVYVTRTLAAEPLRLFDTVYLEKQPESRSYSKKQEKQDFHSYPRRENNLPGSVNIVPVEKLEAPENNQRNNSIKDDSLIRKFAFVTL